MSRTWKIVFLVLMVLALYVAVNLYLLLSNVNHG